MRGIEADSVKHNEASRSRVPPVVTNPLQLPPIAVKDCFQIEVCDEIYFHRKLEQSFIQQPLTAVPGFVVFGGGLIYSNALPWLVSPGLIILNGEVIAECSVFDYQKLGVWIA